MFPQYFTYKVKFALATKAQRGSRGIALTFNLGARWGGCSTSRPNRFTPGKKPVPILYEAEWTPGSFWMLRKNSPPRVFEPRTVQPVAGHYTDYAIQPHSYFI